MRSSTRLYRPSLSRLCLSAAASGALMTATALRALSRVEREVIVRHVTHGPRLGQMLPPPADRAVGIARNFHKGGRESIDVTGRHEPRVHPVLQHFGDAAGRRGDEWHTNSERLEADG